MRKRTFLGRLTAAALAISALSGTAFAQMAASIDAPVTITFYNYNLASASAGADATRELIADFEAQNPNIKVETVAVPSNEIVTRLQADLAAGQQPDVAQLVFRDLYYIASDLGANALEDMAGAEGYAELVDGLIPRGLDLGKIDGKTYGLAYTFSTPVLFYNADLFRPRALIPTSRRAPGKRSRLPARPSSRRPMRKASSPAPMVPPTAPSSTRRSSCPMAARCATATP